VAGGRRGLTHGQSRAKKGLLSPRPGCLGQNRDDQQNAGSFVGDLIARPGHKGNESKVAQEDPAVKHQAMNLFSTQGSLPHRPTSLDTF
jgi:hypothetical protein